MSLADILVKSISRARCKRSVWW